MSLPTELVRPLSISCLCRNRRWRACPRPLSSSPCVSTPNSVDLPASTFPTTATLQILFNWKECKLAKNPSIWTDQISICIAPNFHKIALVNAPSNQKLSGHSFVRWTLPQFNTVGIQCGRQRLKCGHLNHTKHHRNQCTFNISQLSATWSNPLTEAAYSSGSMPFSSLSPVPISNIVSPPLSMIRCSSNFFNKSNCSCVGLISAFFPRMLEKSGLLLLLSIFSSTSIVLFVCLCTEIWI